MHIVTYEHELGTCIISVGLFALAVVNAGDVFSEVCSLITMCKKQNMRACLTATAIIA